MLLEQAKLAVVKSDPQLFKSSLTEAMSLTKHHFNLNAKTLKDILDELDELRKTNLERPMPDITGSLKVLKQAKQKN